MSSSWAIEWKRAERRAAPQPARIPAGDRQTYPFDQEGST